MKIKRRGFPLASRCPLCGGAEEELHHVLIHCPMVWEPWGALLSSMGTVWVCPPLGQRFFFFFLDKQREFIETGLAKQPQKEYRGCVQQVPKAYAKE